VNQFIFTRSIGSNDITAQVPGILHHIAPLPNSLAWQPYQAALLGSLARKPCLAALPGSLAWQPCLAALPGSLAWQPCPAAIFLPNSRPDPFFITITRLVAFLTIIKQSYQT
jgi:hypothetical protein